MPAKRADRGFAGGSLGGRMHDEIEITDEIREYLRGAGTRAGIDGIYGLRLRGFDHRPSQVSKRQSRGQGARVVFRPKFYQFRTGDRFDGWLIHFTSSGIRLRISSGTFIPEIETLERVIVLEM